MVSALENMATKAQNIVLIMMNKSSPPPRPLHAAEK